MDLYIQKLTKAFNEKIVFEDLNFNIRSGTSFAITGPNGSGKSTLLKILSGGSLPTSGAIEYRAGGKIVRAEDLYRHVHFVAPYNTVIEELTPEEIFSLHQKLGLLLSYSDYKAWSEELEYTFNPRQQIKMFSSGMKQRIKLGLCLLDDRPLILLDEPGSNLDSTGKAWLQSLLTRSKPFQTLVIASNDPREIEYCPQSISLSPL